MNCVMLCLIVASVMVCMTSVASTPYWLTSSDTEDFADMTDTGVPMKDVLGEDIGAPMFSRMRKQFPQMKVAFDTYNHKLQSGVQSSGSSSNPRFNRGNRYRAAQA